ncbi:zinc metalloproteinase-disintegrin-like batroxstatin-2 isoform X1 [Protopterus annectens]|uniref:zinc metalloproteinase-disintegrin-like batroxstatin-2 isoform X1 n=1 Tax=Protopterus annectens TaxID=7888 RepID=UPI001CFACFF2|nr:zinc metalloproteinase-disintegrin-like batroxstatin-2 isoform X1 [Protopterus annectens]
MFYVVCGFSALLFVTHYVTAIRQLPGIQSYELVVPRKLHSQHKRDTEAQYPDVLKYGLRVEGKDLVLHLEKNEDLIAKNFSETYYLPDGQEVTNTPEYKDHCYYQGHISNDNNSAASISICNGISGYFQTAEQRYLIEPLMVNDTGVHAVYRYENITNGPKVCGVTNDTWEGGGPKLSRTVLNAEKKEFLAAKKYIELYLVADRTVFEKYRTLDAVRKRLFEIVNFINLVYKEINSFVALIGIDIWNNGDKMTVSSNSGTTLDSFMSWRSSDLLKRKQNDNAQLLTNVDFDGATVGLAFVATMCAMHSAGIIQDHTLSSIGIGATMAHEMGHNLGMSHDTSSCVCSSGSCIMQASLSSNFPREFSSCSQQNLQSFFLDKMPQCIRNIPDKQMIVATPVCGNGFVEVGEDCDCGTVQECVNPCCNASSCKLKPQAQCVAGECCKDCKVKPFGDECRASKHDCDLPEFCSGQSAVCPPDRFRVNGYPCSNGKGYCINGTCPQRDQQCKYIWGQDAVLGTDDCFQHNTLGRHFAYCKKSPAGTFISCKQKDIYCGKLFCIGGTSPAFVRIATYGTCKTTFSEEKDLSLVNDGTKCGEEKVCSQGECLDIEAVFRSTNCSAKCRGHAVCDHELKCQCEEGYKPPYCEKSLSRGAVIAIAVIVCIVLIALISGILFLWYKNKGRRRGQRQYVKTVSGITNPGFAQQEQMKNRPNQIPNTVVMAPTSSTPVPPSKPGYLSAPSAPAPARKPLLPQGQNQNVRPPVPPSAPKPVLAPSQPSNIRPAYKPPPPPISTNKPVYPVQALKPINKPRT